MTATQMPRHDVLDELQRLMLAHGPQHLTDAEAIALVGLLRGVVDRLHGVAPPMSNPRGELIDIMECNSPDDLLLPEVLALLAVLRPFRDRVNPSPRLRLVTR